MADLSFGMDNASLYDWCKRGRVYSAYATVSAPVIWSTAAGTGGPLLWNNSKVDAVQAVNAVILAVGVGVTTASGAASALGLTGGTGQTAAPTSNTAIDASGNMFVGGGFTSACHVYRKGTVTNAGTFFIPTHAIDTGALTTLVTAISWVNVAGTMIVPPLSWGAVAAAATATSAVCSIGLLWAEIPL